MAVFWVTPLPLNKVGNLRVDSYVSITYYVRYRNPLTCFHSISPSLLRFRSNILYIRWPVHTAWHVHSAYAIIESPTMKLDDQNYFL